MRPQPASIMSGTADWTEWKVPVRLTARMRSQASGVMSVNAMNPSMPALVTSTSTGPRAWRTLSSAASTDARSLTSTSSANASAPAVRSSSAARSAPAPSRSSSATLWPRPASWRLTAYPMPDAAPVTTATRFTPSPRCAASRATVSAPRTTVQVPLLFLRRALSRGGPRAGRSRGMRIGLMVGPERGRYATKVERLRADAQWAEGAGLATVWVPQVPDDFDALTAAALIGLATDRIEIGTAVVPVQPRHPIALAQQALSVQAVCDGRLTLGLGVSHHWIIDEMLGLSYEKPLRTMRAYLEVLEPALRGP